MEKNTCRASSDGGPKTNKEEAKIQFKIQYDLKQLAPGTMAESPLLCSSCDASINGAPQTCWACTKFDGDEQLFCESCIASAPCCGACETFHSLCEEHMSPPAEGYERDEWLEAHDMAESEPDCKNCVNEDGEVNEEERSGCAVCDGTGHVKCGKGGYRPSTYNFHLDGVKD
jgi:hypothetical protein